MRDPIRIPLAPFQKAALGRMALMADRVALEKSVFLTAIIASEVDPQTVGQGSGVMVELTADALVITYPEGM